MAQHNHGKQSHSRPRRIGVGDYVSVRRFSPIKKAELVSARVLEVNRNENDEVVGYKVAFENGQSTDVSIGEVLAP
jgi:hypothetical protein